MIERFLCDSGPTPIQQRLKEVEADSKINFEHSESPQSGSGRVKIAWFGVRKLISNVRSVLPPRFRMDTYYNLLLLLYKIFKVA
jgi:hypothetical protein